MCLREWMSNMVFSLSLTLSLTLSLVSFCIGQIIRYNQMSSIHILVPTPSFPPTEEHDDDEQAAPLALTWCCVYIVSILEKKTFSLSLSLCVCLNFPHSLTPSPSPSLSLPLQNTPNLLSPRPPSRIASKSYTS